MSISDTKPLISVVLPVYNNGAFLLQALDSLLSQSYKNFEIIAIDDFSKDDSWKILKIYKKFDNRIRIFRNVKHYDKAITLNRCLRKAKGQYITLMDPEDVCYKDRFKKQVEYLLENPKTSAVGVQCTFIDEKGKKLGLSSYPLDFDAIYHKPHHGISIHFETAMINRLVLPKDLLKFDINASPFLYSNILIKLLQFGPLVNLPRLLQYHRKHTIINKESVLTKTKQIPNLLKLWIKSVDEYDYRPSLRSFFLSML